MKRVGFLVLMLVLFPLLANAQDENFWDRKLPFESATIEYALSGVEKGTEVLYIRDYGRQTAKYHKTKTNMMGMSIANETIEITDPEWIYTFDMVKRKGTKAVNPNKYMAEEYDKLSRKEKAQVRKNSEELGFSMAGQMGGKVEPEAATLLGYSCDKMTIMGATVYTIHDSGIPLKTESNMMGVMIKSEATKMTKGEAPKDKFKHPEGITPVIDQEADEMARAMAKQTMDTLKDPDAKEKMADSVKTMKQDQQNEDMTEEEKVEMEKAIEALKGFFNN